jgi:nuclear transcription factor Y, gamma
VHGKRGRVIATFSHLSLSCVIHSLAAETENWKIQPLPLARVKKIMKSEEFVLQEMEKDRLRDEGQEIAESDKPTIKFMISGEAPLLMSKACELLINELSCRAWHHTERSKRRTLQRHDVHAAVAESEVYDFLIDIVPRINTSASAATTTSRSGNVQQQQQLPSSIVGGQAMPPMPAAPQLLSTDNDAMMQHQQQVAAVDYSQMQQDLQNNQFYFFQQQMQGLADSADGNAAGQQHQQQLLQHLATTQQQQAQPAMPWNDDAA